MSGPIRTKIGQTKRRLRLHLPALTAAIANESAYTTAINERTDEDILEDLQILLELRGPFVKAYRALLKEHEAFSALRIANPAEELEFTKYTNTYGDYTVELKESSDILANVDSLIEKLTAEGRTRRLPIADDNDDALTTTTGKSTEPTPAPRTSIQQTDITNINENPITTPSIPPKIPGRISQKTVQGKVISTSFSPTNDTTEETESNPITTTPPPQQVFYVQPDAASSFVTAALVGKSLPRFSGDILDWPEFQESFLSLVQNGRITGADKLSLLKMCLEGEAKEVIAGLPKIDRNYDHAMILLSKEYDKPHLRHHSLLTRLRTLPPCDGKGGLRNFYLKLNVIIRQLLPNGEVDTPDMLVNLITSKLPIAMQTRVIKESSRKEDFGVYSVLGILADAVEDEKIERDIMANTRAERRIEKPSPPITHSNITNAPSHHSNNTERNRVPRNFTKFGKFNPNQSCRLCSGLHRIDACPSYTTPSDRKTAAIQRNLCLNCLHSNHAVNDCRSKINCHYCKGRHHSATCTNLNQNQSPIKPRNGDFSNKPKPIQTDVKNPIPYHNAKNSSKRSPPQKQQTNCVLTEEVFEEVTMTVQSNPETPVTAIAQIKSSTQPLLCLETILHSPFNPTQTIKATVLFDSASTCSYITNELANSLDLPLIESRRIATQVFGKTKIDHRTVGIFPIGVTLKNGSQHNIATLSTPMICKEINWLKKDADSTITAMNSSPSLLIGMDLFLEFFLGDNFSMSRTDDGIHILSTPMGDIATRKRVNNRNIFSTIMINPSYPISSDTIPDLAKLEEMMKRFFSVEIIGITDSPETNDDDNRGLEHFLANIRFNENERRYYVALPFREENPQLPTNFDIYVDNFFGHANSIEEGIRQFHGVREFFTKANFNLREFVSNNPILNELFLSHNAAASDLTHAKILGVHWNTSTDSYSLPTMKLPSDDTQWTKRLTLRHLNGFYDPYGMKDQPVFVRNRTTKINSLLPTAKFKHIDGKLNPADVASRGCTSDELNSHPLWWHGPPFLSQPQSTWNPQPELQSPSLKETTMAINSISVDPIHEPIVPIIEANRFHSWTKMVNTTIIVLKFIQRLKKIPTTLSRVSLHRRAEQLLFRMSQTEFPPTPHLIQQLRMYQCPTTSLWRCRGRLENAEIPIESKCPIYLPRESAITRLFILYIHHSINHFGQSHTLTELRQRVWIPKGITTVKSSLRHCMQCKRARAKPFALPEYPDLPTIRTVQPDHPYSAIGLDLAGPIQYRTDDNSKAKSWILVITCLHIRATYLDIITDMSLKTLLSRIRRFIATYGSPSTIVCDNASSFVALNKLQEAFRESERNDISDYCARKGIQFHFITPFTPWSGGVYERIVGLTKTALKSVLGTRTLLLEELSTILKEAEAVLNSRPLTSIGSDLDHLPLRPMDFLRPHASLSLPRLQTERGEDDTDKDWRPRQNLRDSVVDSWTHSMTILNQFWKRWKREYLTSLREKYKREHDQGRLVNYDSPQYGDVVIIADPALERGQWKLGKIIQIKSDRSAIVKTATGTLHRPLNLLYKLEIEPQSKPITDQNLPIIIDQNSTKDDNPKPIPLRRSARLNPTLTLLATIALLSTLGSASDAQCPQETSAQFHVIYVTPCTQHGFGVATTKDISSDTQSVCWLRMQCPNGHLRLPNPNETNSNYCGPQCKCPEWTRTCSFYNGIHVNFSTIAHLPSELRNFVPSHVCSFKKENHCDNNALFGLFSQIELMDGTSLIVPKLDVATTDVYSPDDHRCYDMNGKELLHFVLSTHNPVIGSSSFCRVHSCTTKDKATAFCFYGEKVTSFVFLDKQIPIRAWGTIRKLYYPHAKNDSKTTQSLIAIKCAYLGIEVHPKEEATSISIRTCISLYCIFLQELHPIENPIQFPWSIVSNDHEIIIQSWTEGVSQLDEKIKCQGRPLYLDRKMEFFTVLSRTLSFSLFFQSDRHPV
ncbi:hypothetical protein PRIPAC_77413 [Pristionchus pacificus]|uniref:Integrase catalytic domain-containing protein n=1 Tax=Pristionchus pacificus TaxID=54126 RepID=A0A2A6CLQ4_PRIPA|nr:hypothetical protein PRIPAC_77413 [Pristionchus pacificus]|eukprot:PDM79030.1 hypothetical protein PRIPAC_31609 [Pristionchus pacificus]